VNQRSGEIDKRSSEIYEQRSQRARRVLASLPLWMRDSITHPDVRKDCRCTDELHLVTQDCATGSAAPISAGELARQWRRRTGRISFNHEDE